MSVPTQGETYAQLNQYIIKAQEAAAMMAHLCNANGDTLNGKGWLGISEMLKLMNHQITLLASKKLH